jgi:hypothetical protein
MNKHPSYETRNIRRIFGSLVTVLFCGLLVKPVPAVAWITPDIKTIAIVAAFGESQNDDSSTPREMDKFLNTSPVVNRENIENIAVKYLAARLKGEVSVLVWDKRDAGKLSYGVSSLLVRLDYSVWPLQIDGKPVKVGTMAVHVTHLLKEGHYCFDNNDFTSLPVDSFVVTDDPAQTQHNLEAAVARQMDGFGRIDTSSDYHH